MYNIEIRDSSQIFNLKSRDELLAQTIQSEFDELYTILKLTNRYSDILFVKYNNYCIYKFNVYHDFPNLLNRSYFIDFTTTHSDFLFHFCFNNFKEKKRIHIDTNYQNLISDFSALFSKIKML